MPTGRSADGRGGGEEVFRARGGGGEVCGRGGGREVSRPKKTLAEMESLIQERKRERKMSMVEGNHQSKKKGKGTRKHVDVPENMSLA